LDKIYQDWTPAQAEAILLAEGGKSGEEIAALLQVSPSAVSQRLANTYWEAYFRMTKIINKMMDGSIQVNDLTFANLG
jgi:predicted transcriptional regulator